MMYVTSAHTPLDRTSHFVMPKSLGARKYIPQSGKHAKDGKKISVNE